MTRPTETYPEATHRHYLAKVDEVVRSLRELADKVERDGKSMTPNYAGCGPHTYAARGVMHAVAWGLANASLDGLITHAGTADKALENP